MRFLTFLVFTFLSTCIIAQNNGVVKGVLINEKGKIVKQAVIVAEGVKDSYLSNKKGEFEILNVPTGKLVKLSITHESHHYKVIEVNLKNAETKFILA